jgi:DNA segregation ATPase FtsK/SpoIIIE, S-DNA-T family
MANRKPARRGTGRKRATGQTTTNKKTAARTPQRPSRLAALWKWVRTLFGRLTDDLWGVILGIGGLLLILAHIGLAGPLGSSAASGTRFLFGQWTYAVGPSLVTLGAMLVMVAERPRFKRHATGLIVTFVTTLGMFHLMTGALPLSGPIDAVIARGGAVGSLLAFPLWRFIGFWGALVVLLSFLAFGVTLLVGATMRDAAREAAVRAKAVWRRVRGRRPAPVVQVRHTVSPRPRAVPAPPADAPVSAARPEPSRPGPHQRPAPTPRRAPGGTYELPPLDLLSLGGGAGQSKKALDETAAELEEALLQHGVDAQLTRIVPGPTVTRYEIELAPGVKVSRVTSLSHDIAYALASPDIRIIAPIPGKSAIGVEVPNTRRQLVTLGDILRSPEAAAAVHPLEVALGMDISGAPQLINLSELPHVLIAGATGAGKSSCINAIVTSILARTTPEEVRMILVDPKRVELGQYNEVPHLMTQVITNPKKAIDALQWAVREMDRRYDLLAAAGVRDILGYHDRWDADELESETFDRFPYIVVVVDELNDLMMVAGRAVEEAVVRIAQMARAVGIHLVIATQRPSVDVITGVIKANIPSRFAFSVASQADSRVILDHSGAEKLIGLGDMIVVTSRDPHPRRIQGAWVSEEEVHAIVDWVRSPTGGGVRARGLRVDIRRSSGGWWRVRRRGRRDHAPGHRADRALPARFDIDAAAQAPHRLRPRRPGHGHPGTDGRRRSERRFQGPHGARHPRRARRGPRRQLGGRVASLESRVWL